jgi:hypothetical protein
MDVAEALFETNDRLASRRKTEVAGLNDPGMHGSYRDLMQAFAFSW